MRVKHDMVHEIIDMLREERNRQGLTQADIGARMGKPKSRISELEKGRSNVSFQTIVDYADALGVSLRVLRSPYRARSLSPANFIGIRKPSLQRVPSIYEEVFIPDPVDEEDLEETHAFGF